MNTQRPPPRERFSGETEHETLKLKKRTHTNTNPKENNGTMNKHFWKIVEAIVYILKIIYHYDTRRKEPQPAEHPQE